MPAQFCGMYEGLDRGCSLVMCGVRIKIFIFYTKIIYLSYNYRGFSLVMQGGRGFSLVVQSVPRGGYWGYSRG